MKTQNDNFKRAMSECLDDTGKVTRLEPLYNYIEQLEDAAEECHLALKHVVDDEKVGWIQEHALTAISKALGKSPNSVLCETVAKTPDEKTLD
jgi:hypothetical protein